jgi:hypothetical protein
MARTFFLLVATLFVPRKTQLQLMLAQVIVQPYGLDVDSKSNSHSIEN